jgi:hypothetical protein
LNPKESITTSGGTITAMLPKRQERAERVAYYQAKLDALPKYPTKETGFTLSEPLRNELQALDKEFPEKYDFIQEALYPGRYFYLSQLNKFDAKLTKIKRSQTD